MPRPSRKKEVKRVQMDMPPKSLERLKLLQERTEAASYIEVVRNALQLYEAMIDEVEAGNKILIDRDGFFRTRLDKLRARLEELGAVRVQCEDGWYWDLKPDLKPGEVLTL